MGMFDTFILDNKEEIQTKQMDCILGHYSIGDYVPDYPFNFEGPVSSFFIIEDGYSFLIIDNVFIDYINNDDPTELKIITIDMFKTYLTDYKVLSSRLTNIILNTKNPKISEYSNKLNTIYGILYDYGTFLKGNINNRLLSISKTIKNFTDGQSLYDVLTRVQKNESSSSET